MEIWFQQRIVESGRLPLFCFFIALIGAFVATRINVRLIRARIGWFRNVTVGEMHIHHVVFGVVLTLVGGVTGLIVAATSPTGAAVAASIFGVGAALVLDEFALILHLHDVYWEEEGRASVDAVFVAIAVTGLLLIGLRPLNYDYGTFVAPWGLLVANLALAVITLLKGKIWTGMVGLFVPGLLVIGAVRLARPDSPWSRWFYERKFPRKLATAEHREERWRRPPIRVKIAIQEFVSGRHDLPSTRKRP